jgi:hypothetical protein
MLLLVVVNSVDRQAGHAAGFVGTAAARVRESIDYASRMFSARGPFGP